MLTHSRPKDEIHTKRFLGLLQAIATAAMRSTDQCPDVSEQKKKLRKLFLVTVPFYVSM